MSKGRPVATYRVSEGGYFDARIRVDVTPDQARILASGGLNTVPSISEALEDFMSVDVDTALQSLVATVEADPVEYLEQIKIRRQRRLIAAAQRELDLLNKARKARLEAAAATGKEEEEEEEDQDLAEEEEETEDEEDEEEEEEEKPQRRANRPSPKKRGAPSRKRR